MRNLLVCSILSLLLITNSLADENSHLTQKEQDESTDIHQILKDVQCDTKEKINALLKDGMGMVPIVIAHSENEGYDTVVWANLRTQDTLFIKYHRGNGCVFGVGNYLILKYPGGLSSI